MTSAEKLQEVYDGEHHFCISVFWDGGFEVKFGQPGLDGPIKGKGSEKFPCYKGDANFKTAEEAINWLYDKHLEYAHEHEEGSAQA